MSGIAGIYYLDHRPVDRTDLVRMVDILAHRGPDGADVWCEGSVGLGHRMLWTTPESLLEQLPLKDRIGNLIVTADARIDNRDELISALSLNDRPAERITDSDLILATYKKWGDRCPEKLIGDFAFAIWDGRNQKLFCARDHFGIKPFYYYYQPGKVFVLASEIKALHTLPSLPHRVNELRVAEYLLKIFEKANTFYQDIFRLPAGHKMTVSHKSIKLCSYWSLDPSRELRLGSNNEYAEAFSEIFTESVHCRLRSAYSIGSTLSGGLDSSSITCVANKLLIHNSNQPLRTFSTVFDEIPECDERPFIKAVLAQEKENLIPHYINGDHLSPLTDIDRVLWHQDEPFFAANLFLYWNLCHSVKSSGVRILLDGLDGDTVISHGMGYLTELAATGKWFSLTKEVIGCTMHGNESFWSLLWPYLWGYGIKPSHRALILRIGRKLSRKNQSKNNQKTIINRNFAQRIALGEHIQNLRKTSSVSVKTERDDHYRNITQGVMQFMFEIIDRTAAAFSLETNHPFFDKRLVEFCLSLPSEQKIHHGWTRMILRRAMEDVLPQTVQWRKDKNNFEPKIIQGLLTSDRDLVEKVIFKHSKDNEESRRKQTDYQNISLSGPRASLQSRDFAASGGESDRPQIEEYVDFNILCDTYQLLKYGKSSKNLLPVWIAVTLDYWLQNLQPIPENQESRGVLVTKKN